jgi:hypothetical protein
MSVWWNLLHKEYRMTRISAFLALAILSIGGLWLVYLSARYNNIGIIIAPAIFVLIFLLFYPAIYILKSLYWEWKVTPHLWLHCPQPAWVLLSPKMAVALLHMLVVMLITAALLLLGIWVNPISQEAGNFTLSSLLPFIIEAGFYTAAFIFAASIYIGAWATLISVVTAMTANILGRFRWLAGVAVFAVAVAGFGHLQQSWIYEQITHWGHINIQLRSLQEISGLTVDVTGTHLVLGQIYTGEILFHLLLTVALFALSSWLIDHKVEV